MVSTILFKNIKNNKNPHKVNKMIITTRYNINGMINRYIFEYEIAKLIIFYNRIDIINTPCFYESSALLLLSFNNFLSSCIFPVAL